MAYTGEIEGLGTQSGHLGRFLGCPKFPVSVFVFRFHNTMETYPPSLSTRSGHVSALHILLIGFVPSPYFCFIWRERGQGAMTTNQPLGTYVGCSQKHPP
jgi:hypothetical protein